MDTSWAAEGEILNKAANINAAFASFYSSNFVAVVGPSKPALHDYTEELPLPELNPAQISDIELPFSQTKYA
ncbi:hypothetical protein NDU88_005420 [Pleurodeles waltl]|uniref:Uncharacterized protein n=1 Tax=Pleurodeles waltl TaxID=8319 RepID=A0AAV7W803_PLEWA|nr:hypothetical protein NDU88_005420 [Pleurodeles waltl]